MLLLLQELPTGLKFKMDYSAGSQFQWNDSTKSFLKDKLPKSTCAIISTTQIQVHEIIELDEFASSLEEAVVQGEFEAKEQIAMASKLPAESMLADLSILADNNNVVNVGIDLGLCQ